MLLSPFVAMKAL